MEDKSKNLEACKFVMNEIVLCYEPDPVKARMLYDAKILDSDVTKDEKGRKVYEYYIHFQGWNKSWDRWILENQILKANDVNRTVQTKLYNEAIRQKKRKPKSSSKHDSGDEKDDKSVTSMGSISVSGEDDVKVIQLPMVTLDIPKVLAVRLEDDCYNIKRKKKLVHLPRKPSVNEIFNQYYAHCEKIVNTPDGRNKSLRIFYEMIYGFNTYFNYFLFSLLLYNFERDQYHSFFPPPDHLLPPHDHLLPPHDHHIPPHDHQIPPHDHQIPPHLSPPPTPVATKIINYLNSNNGMQSKDSSRSNSRTSSFCEDTGSASISAPLLKEVFKTKCGKKRRSERSGERCRFGNAADEIALHSSHKRKRNNTSCSSADTNPQVSPKPPQSPTVDADKKSTREMRSHAKKPEKIFIEKVSPNAEKAIKPMEILTENIIDMARTTRSSFKSKILATTTTETPKKDYSKESEEGTQLSVKSNPEEAQSNDERYTKEPNKGDNCTKEECSRLEVLKEEEKWSVKCSHIENSPKDLFTAVDINDVTVNSSSQETQTKDGGAREETSKLKEFNEKRELLLTCDIKSTDTITGKNTKDTVNEEIMKDHYKLNDAAVKTSPLTCSSEKVVSAKEKFMKAECTNVKPVSEIAPSKNISVETETPSKSQITEKEQNVNTKPTKDNTTSSVLSIKCAYMDRHTSDTSTVETVTFTNSNKKIGSPVCCQVSQSVNGSCDCCGDDITKLKSFNEVENTRLKCIEVQQSTYETTSTKENVNLLNICERTKSPVKCNSTQTLSDTKENSPVGKEVEVGSKSPIAFNSQETPSKNNVNSTDNIINLKESTEEERALKETNIAGDTLKRVALKELTDINEDVSSNRGVSTKDLFLKESEIKKEEMEDEGGFKMDLCEDIKTNSSVDGVSSMENGENNGSSSRLRRSVRSTKPPNTGVSESDEMEMLPMGSTAKSLQETYKGPLKGKGQLNDKTYMVLPQQANGDTPADIYGLEHLLRLFVKLPVLLSSSNIEEAKMAAILQYATHFMEYLTKRTDLFVDSTTVYSESII